MEPEYVAEHFVPLALDTYFPGNSHELEFCQNVRAGGNHLVVATAAGQTLGKGDRQEVAAPIQRRFYGTIGIDYMEGSVSALPTRNSSMSLTVEKAEDATLVLRLGGYAHLGREFDPKLRTEPKSRYDRTQKAFVRFDVVAPGDVWGRWGDANGNSQTVERAGRTPTGFAFELAPGDSPTNRLPPAGHGGRALRVGYFGAAK